MAMAMATVTNFDTVVNFFFAISNDLSGFTRI